LQTNVRVLNSNAKQAAFVHRELPRATKNARSCCFLPNSCTAYKHHHASLLNRTDAQWPKGAMNMLAPETRVSQTITSASTAKSIKGTTPETFKAETKEGRHYCAQ
jgi:hypothetical protein